MRDSKIAYNNGTKGTLQLNITPQYACSNKCTFCYITEALKEKPTSYEQRAKTSLFLPTPLSTNEILTAIKKQRKIRNPKEISFIGLGEPLLEFNLVNDTIKNLRRNNYKGRISLETNGQVKCWYEDEPAEKLKNPDLTLH